MDGLAISSNFKNFVFNKRKAPAKYRRTVVAAPAREPLPASHIDLPGSRKKASQRL